MKDRYSEEYAHLYDQASYHTDSNPPRRPRAKGADQSIPHTSNHKRQRRHICRTLRALRRKIHTDVHLPVPRPQRNKPPSGGESSSLPLHWPRQSHREQASDRQEDLRHWFRTNHYRAERRA